MFKSDVSAFQSSPSLRRQITEASRLFLVAAVFLALGRVLSKHQGSPCLFTASHLSAVSELQGPFLHLLLLLCFRVVVV